MFSLRRIIKPDDGAGIPNGITATIVKPSDGDEEPLHEPATEPMVGWVLLVENFNFWYHTSTVTEIISEEENDDRVKIVFKTLNSTYEFRRFK